MKTGLRILALSLFAVHTELAAQAPPDFQRDIGPLLHNHCLKCHGAGRSENGLRLDSRASALAGGDHGPAVTPGRSSESLILRVVQGTHPEIPPMPRKGTPLTQAEISLLKAWIDAGAPWPETIDPIQERARRHWAFQPIGHPTPPNVTSPTSVPPHPIDAFVSERLTREQLALSPEASRQTLIRRLSLDLTGLPPSPDDVDAFVGDPAADAYERLVQRLLQSPHFGERWARWWLDSARYADSNGYEKDRTRSIWPWRDWVIRAWNEGMPFDRFTIEQLAGDLLPSPTLDQRIATGFLRNSMLNQEGGIEPEKFRSDAMFDRIDAVGRTWLGLTIGCGQCHSHKYDPISQSEYYRFFAFLNQDDEPRLEVPSPQQQANRSGILDQVRRIEDDFSARPGLAARFESWLEQQSGEPIPWRALKPDEWHSQPMKFELQEDLSLLAGGDIYNNGVLRVWVDIAETNLTGFRLEALNDANLPFNGPGLEGTGEFQLCEFTVDAIPLAELSAANRVPTTNRIRFARAAADAWADGSHPDQTINGDTTDAGWHSGFTRGRRNEERRIVFQAAQPFGFTGGTRLLITLWSKPRDSKLSNFIIGRVRLSTTTAAGELSVAPLSERQRSVARLPAAHRSEAQRRELWNAFRTHQTGFEDVTRAWDDAWAAWPRAEVSTLVLSQRPVPRKTRILRRGEWNRPTTEVTAGVPAFLHPLPTGADTSRLTLARWIVSTHNPLTPRVIVNRLWQQLFGQGLVTTPEDFGARAEPPSHPELLDWLARAFMDRGWNVRDLIQLIVTSKTYRQSSRIPPELLERDPANRLLARAPRFRVDAEMIQDIALKASGLLSPRIGGPGVFPPLPEGVMQLSFGPIPWNTSEGDDRYRRAMYTFWKRSIPYPAMVTFDAPTAEQSCVRRIVSNTPLQALTTLNEPTLHQAARWLAWRVLSQAPATDSARLTQLYRLVLSRRPDEHEHNVLLHLLESAQAEYQRQPREAAAFAFQDPKNPPPLPGQVTTAQLAAWTAVSRAALNLDEAITRE